MRVFVLILLLVNLAYLGWSLTYPRSTEQAPALTEEGVAGLRLLSEVAVPSAPVPASAEDAGSATEEPAARAKNCYTIGPFADAAQAMRLVDEIGARGLAASRRDIERQEVAGYWVYLPPSRNRARALAMAGELARKGVKDYYVVPSGDFENAISLGLFSEPARAERRAAYIRALGYEPLSNVRYRTKAAFWVDYDEVDADVLPGSVWSAMAVAGGAPLQRVDRECAAAEVGGD